MSSGRTQNGKLLATRNKHPKDSKAVQTIKNQKILDII